MYKEGEKCKKKKKYNNKTSVTNSGFSFFKTILCAAYTWNEKPKIRYALFIELCTIYFSSRKLLDFRRVYGKKPGDVVFFKVAAKFSVFFPENVLIYAL